MTNPNDDYTSRGWLVTTAALAVLILVSFIPPIEAGGVSLRRASIISDLVTLDSATTEAEQEAGFANGKLLYGSKPCGNELTLGAYDFAIIKI